MTPLISIITSVFNGEEYLDRFFSSVTNQTIIDVCELIIVLNQGSEAEKAFLRSLEKQKIVKCNFIFLDFRETLPASWNRGIREANGEFVTFWNVDDLRIANSLEKQIQTLIKNDDISLTYGDFIEINSPDSTKGLHLHTPLFNKSIFLRRFACGGAFLFMRKVVFDKYGFFDEQFIVASDFEFVMRLVFFNEQLQKTSGILGYFLNNQSGLSTNLNSNLSEIERNVIYKRYGILDKIKPEFESLSKNYEIDNFTFFGELIPSLSIGLNTEKLSQLNLSKKLIYFVKNIVRRVLILFGLWEKSILLRDRIFGYKK